MTRPDTPHPDINRKDRIAAAFSAAAPRYDRAAAVQDHVAAILAARVLALPWATAPRGLEIGCGTGGLTRRLVPALPGDWLLTDVSPAMLAAAVGATPGLGMRTHRMDGEHPDVAGPFDLIVSSMAAQWFADPVAGLGRLAALLAPGGRLLAATLAEGTFAEWHDAHQALGLSCGVLPFPAAEAFARAGMAVASHPTPVQFADSRAFARSLKHIGAHVPAGGHRPLTVAEFRRLSRHLGANITMTYHVVVCEIRA